MNCRAGSTAGAGLLQRSEGRRVNKAGLGFLGEGGRLDCGTASHLFDLPGGFFFQLLTVGDVVGGLGKPDVGGSLVRWRTGVRTQTPSTGVPLPPCRNQFEQMRPIRIGKNTFSNIHTR